MFPVTSYTLARINLVRAACPYEIMGSIDNAAVGKPLIVEKNRKRYGYVESTDYYPKAVVVSGGNLRSRLLERGIIHAMAFVEGGSMNLGAEDAVGFHEMMSQIQSLLNRRLYGKDECGTGQAQANIEEVYPFDNAFTFAWRGQKHQQRYIVDPVDKKLALAGQSVEVKACGGVPMPLVQTGVRYAQAPIYPALAVSSRGAANSELVTCVIRDWSNINEAVSTYISSMKTGFKGQMKPAFQPVALDKSASIVDHGTQLKKAMVKAGIDPFHFAMWSVEAQKYQTRDKKRNKVGTIETSAV